MIAFACVGCGKLLQVDEHLAGRRFRCKHCGAVAKIPAAVVPPIPVIEVARGAPPAEAEAPRSPSRRKNKKATARDAWISLAIGSGLAVIALLIRLVGFIPDVLITVIHELGHVATAWLFGSPALPSFDLSYGGGVSYSFARQPILIALVYAALAGLAYRSRKERRALFTMLVLIGVYSLAVFSPLRDVLITAMGHGAELCFAGVFLHRALSGNHVLRREERPLYAFLGIYIVLADARFAFRLMTSHDYREEYGLEKGGGHTMDFSRIADEHLHGHLEVVAAFFLLACTLTPVFAFLMCWLKRRRK
jgi:hypothetical protein